MDLLEFGVDGRIVHTPGHTSGSISLLLDSGEAFVGDLAVNYLPFNISIFPPVC
jgi:hydroxyacylglutathione hydrolase